MLGTRFVGLIYHSLGIVTQVRNLTKRLGSNPSAALLLLNIFPYEGLNMNTLEDFDFSKVDEILSGIDEKSVIDHIKKHQIRIEIRKTPDMGAHFTEIFTAIDIFLSHCGMENLQPNPEDCETFFQTIMCLVKDSNKFMRLFGPDVMLIDLDVDDYYDKEKYAQVFGQEVDDYSDDWDDIIKNTKIKLGLNS